MKRNMAAQILVVIVIALAVLTAGCTPSAKKGFESYLMAPIPASVTILHSGGISGLETVWGCRFEISPSDLELVIASQGLVRTNISASEQARLATVFTAYVKTPVAPPDSFEFYELRRVSGDGYPEREYYLFAHPNHSEAFFLYTSE